MRADEKLFFRLAGLSEKESELLSAVLATPGAKTHELANSLGLDGRDLLTMLSSLKERGIVELTSDDKVRIVPRFAVKAAASLESSADEFVEKLRSTRFLAAGRFLEEVQRIFQTEGYVVKKDLAEKSKIRLGATDVAYSFIAEKFYRFGVLVLGPDSLQGFGSEDVPLRYFWRMLPELEETAHCVGTFVLFGPELSERSVAGLRRVIAESRMRYPYRRRERFLFVLEPDRPLKEFLVDSLGKIESRRESVEERFGELRDRIRTVRDLVAEDSMMVSELSSLLSGKFRSFRSRRAESPGFMPTVKSVVDREARNLWIFERKFSEEKSFVEQAVDDFDKRQLLPDPVVLKEKMKELDLLEGKFKPIRDELRTLSELLLAPYAAGAQPMKLNPFILTEPNDIESFTVNQGEIKSRADKFWQRFSAGGANLFFLTGAAGTGKTHALKHVLLRKARESNIWPIYVDCPQSYDLVSSLFAEITQDRNFPPKTRDYLVSLRRRKPSTELEFVSLLRKLRDLVCAEGFKGLALVIDELENSLPYTYDFRYTGQSDGKSKEAALALQQLRAVLSSDASRDLAFVLAFREHILVEVKEGLGLKDFDSFVARPETLTAKHFKELAHMRQEVWRSRPITFPLPVVRKVLAKTQSNTRHTIQYFRALYQLASERKLKRMTNSILGEIGELALFTY